MKLKILSVFILLFNHLAFSQILNGTVLEKSTQLPVYGATVYFDGTTKGVITNEKGEFKIAIPKGVKSSLIISYLGFYKIQLQPSLYINKKIKAYLETKEEALNEIVLAPDNWTRKKKLYYFKKEFLGKDLQANQCKIANEEDVVIRYNKSTNELSAYAKKPIVIENKYLGYRVVYDLNDFNLQLKKNHFRNTRYDSHLVIQSFYEGTSFFKDLTKKNKYKRNRKHEYNGSILHLMRSIKDNSLEKNGFIIFKGSLAINSNKIIKVLPKEDNFEVAFSIKRINLLYKNKKQSFLVCNSEDRNISIDNYGNYFPAAAISFGGYLGKKRMSTLLPLDYNLSSTKDLQ